MTNLSFNKTRIAPTPSGYLHMGNAASFLMTSALARETNAKLLLRIDDMDKERVRKEYVEDIFTTLRFLGINWQEGPGNYNEFAERYSQAHRMKLYEESLQQLREEKNVFACRCSRMQLQNGNECGCREKDLSLDFPNTSWRLVTDEALPLTVLSMNGICITASLPFSMKSFVVRKKDGLPSYQLSSLVDDDYFGVDAIVRGQDLWESTLAQQYLALKLDKKFFREVVFHHHPLLMDAQSGNKLSKSAGASSVRHLEGEGTTREELIKLIDELMPGWIV